MERQNRRGALIETALAPVSGEFDQVSLNKHKAALALIIGTESMIVFKDVLRFSDAEAREVREWAIAALIEAGRKGTVNREGHK